MIPATDHDWTIHSMNIHGAFFERWCQHIMGQSKVWHVQHINFPVMFPPIKSPYPSHQSALDIAAEYSSPRSNVSLLVECKKHDPRFIEWIFFPKRRHPDPNLYFVHQITTMSNSRRESGWQVGHSVAQLSNKVPIADDARETRGNYSSYTGDRQQKTRTSNHNILDAARQITLATHALILDEIGRNQLESNSSAAYHLPYDTKSFVPAIVTTARLFSCDFDPIDVDSETGEIAYDRVTLTEHPVVVYEYPIPRDLQFDPFDLNPYNLPTDVHEWRSEQFIRMHIVVINSASFADFLPLSKAQLGIG